MVGMHGHARLVERKIRVWIVHQELNRRKEGQRIRINTRANVPVRPRQRTDELSRWTDQAR